MDVFLNMSEMWFQKISEIFLLPGPRKEPVSHEESFASKPS